MGEECSEIRPELPAFAAGELEGARRDACERHLRACPDCREECEVWSRVVGDLAALAPPESLAQSARSRLDQHLAWLARRRPAALRRAVGGLAAAAAMLLGFHVLWGLAGTDLRWPSLDPRPSVLGVLHELRFEGLGLEGLRPETIEQHLPWDPFHEANR
ncbi:MAG: anti-sigma factor [Planctomycetota bacterium]